MNTKHWLQSTTIRGALITVLPTLLLVLRAFGVEVAEEEAQRVIDAFMAVLDVVGLVLVVVGRFRAKSSLRT